MGEETVFANLDNENKALADENKYLDEELEKTKRENLALKETLKRVMYILEDKLSGFNGVFKFAVENVKNEIAKILEKNGVENNNGKKQ